MRRIKAFRGKLELTDDVETILEKKVTKFGNGAKLDCPKEHIGKRAYILIVKEE